MLDELKSTVIERIEQRKDDLITLNDFLQRNPEIGHREYRSAWLLSSLLENEGFVVERNIAGMETAFKAIIRGKYTRPLVALLAEYDALPEVGHGCGHNIIATAAVGAALGLKKVIDQVKGTLIVLGCPAEEDPLLSGAESTPHKPGGKIILIDNGEFDEVDFAMMIHPAQEPYCYMKRTSSVASTVLQVSFLQNVPRATGTFTEAATQVTTQLEMLADELPAGSIVRIERRDEGRDWVELRIRLRTPNIPTVKTLAAQVVIEAENVAKKSGVMMYHREFMHPYSDMVWNMPMSEAFRQNLLTLGQEPRDSIDRPNLGDEGNVSYVVPTICTWIPATRSLVPLHTKEFADDTNSEIAHQCILLGAKSLAMTTLDLFSNPQLVDAALAEFQQVAPVRSAEISTRIHQARI